MTIHRIDIEKALDEIISDEEGMTFQGLAVVLAKLKWPEFIASERHNDLGLDAYVPAGLASDRTGKALASSLTATLDKIKGDVEKFTKHVNDVRILVFATPKKVTRETEKKWGCYEQNNSNHNRYISVIGTTYRGQIKVSNNGGLK